MKKLILTALVGAFAVISVQAQEIPERKHEGYMPHAKERAHHKKQLANLNLSEEQKGQLKSLNEEHHKKMEELKKQDNITVKESRDRMEKLRKEHHEKFQALLTPEQKAQIEKNKEVQKARMDEMNKKRGEKLKTVLGLSDEQSAKMETNRKQMGEKMRAIREDKSLSDEQKKEKTKELMKQQKENMKSILTEEQLKKLKESRDHKDGDRKEKTEAKKTTI